MKVSKNFGSTFVRSEGFQTKEKLKHRKCIVPVLLVILIASLLFLLSGCGKAEMKQDTVYAMGTNFTITAYGSKASQGISSAESTILAVDAMSDPDLETSTCYALNHAQGEQMNVSGQIAEMLIDAKEIYEKTEGAYDLSLYPLIKKWGFTDGRYYIPTDEEIAECLLLRGMDQLSISRFANSGTYAVILPSYVQLSFASCARGCASKYAVDALKKTGVESAVVSLSGNVQTLGSKPDGSDWSIGITDPKNPTGYLGVLSVGETAVSTTGAYQQMMTGNTEYHHIMSATTGYPTSNTLLSVSVVCSDGTKADCLSTAMYAMGKNKALNYWREYGDFEMILIEQDGSVICTSGLLELFELKNSNYTLTYAE